MAKHLLIAIVILVTSSILIVFNILDVKQLFISISIFFCAYIIFKINEWRRDLEFKANYDSLTGLLNRESFTNKLDDLLYNNTKFAVLLMDIDRFKTINDTLGHPQGDYILRQFASRLKAATRNHDFIARLGGDEFAVILTDFSHNEDIEVVSKRIQNCVAFPFSVDYQSMDISVSIGISIFPTHGKNVSDIVKHADIAMYTAKQNKLGYYIYNEDADETSLEMLTLRMDLRRAIDNDEILLEYQPKKSLKLDSIVGIEALVRWNHPKLGLISPGRFIPIAEQYGLISYLTSWVLDRALNDFKELVTFIPTLSVNMSPYVINEKDLLLNFSQTLSSVGISPENVIIEITETSIQHSLDRMLKVLLCMDILGVNLSIDDYGTGQSSLLYLKHLPVKEIKIDRQFVSNMLKSKQEYLIVKNTINLAHELDCMVCAEGVEDKETEDALKELGCDIIQGYYLSRPLSKKNLIGFLNDYDNLRNCR